jgi:hypothetical protein
MATSAFPAPQSSPKKPVKDPVVLRFRFRQPQLAADGSLKLVFINVATLHYQLISNHDGRGHWQPQSGVFFGTILLIGFGCGLDFHLVFFPQPGDDFSEMPSGLAAGLV